MADPIDTTLRLIDKISKPLTRIARSTEHVINRMERLQKLTSGGLGLGRLASTQLKAQESIEKTAKSFQSLTMQAISSGNAIKKLSTSTGEFNKVINAQKKVKVEQDNITKSVNKTNEASNNWGSSIRNVLGTYIGFQAVTGSLKISDEVIQTTSRIDIMNDGLQTTAELQKQIYKSAQASTGSFLGIQQAVAKIGLLAGDAFSSSSEIVSFTELVQKSFTVSGASTVEQEAGLYQLTQALASGRLQGDEFRSITENAPLIAQAISKYMGISQGALKELSSEGVITADIIRAAMFNSADDINEKFGSIPKTFGGVFTEVKNFAVNTFAPVLNSLNNSLNSETGINAINNIKLAIQGAVPIINSLINGVLSLSNIFNTVYPYLPAIITTVVTALTAQYLITKQQIIMDTIANAKKAILTATVFAQTVAVSGLTVAWRALNAVMKANVIIVIIGAVIALVSWLINLWKTNDEFAIGLLRIWHGILNFFDQIPVFFWTLVDAMMEPFKMWAKTIGKLYDTVINGIISGINSVLGLVNKVTGSSYEIGAKFSMENIANSIDEWVGNKKISAQNNADGKAYLRQLDLAQFTANRANKASQNANVDDYGTSLGSLGGAGGYGNLELGDIGKVGEVGKINDTVDISSEDLKTLRELAELNSIQNFVTLKPSITFGDTNVRSDGKSTDEIIREITRVVDEQFNSSARKVFA